MFRGFVIVTQTFYAVWLILCGNAVGVSNMIVDACVPLATVLLPLSSASDRTYATLRGLCVGNGLRITTKTRIFVTDCIILVFP